MRIVFLALICLIFIKNMFQIVLGKTKPILFEILKINLTAYISIAADFIDLTELNFNHNLSGKTISFINCE